jgi:4-amino-4-deoxy-L-arabinose transferase-like glycosyltransferase
MKFSWSDNKKLVLIIVTIWLLKMCLLPLVQCTDPDAVSRVFFAEMWLENPHWIAANVWVPLHYYLNAFSLLVYENRVWMPVVVNIFLSGLMLWPLFQMVKREFNSKVAFYSVFILTFSPLVFRNSFMNMSEIPFLLLLACAMNELSLALHSNRWKNYVAAGIALTLAAGFRYEGWILLPIWVLITCYNRQLKKAIIMGCIGGIFPLIWVISNFWYTGDAFYFYNFQSDWQEATHVLLLGDDWEDIARKWWFVPFSLMVAIGPIFLGMVVYSSIRIRRAVCNKWIIPFIVMLIFQLYMTISGRLLLHQRFILTALLLGVPYVGFALFQVKDRFPSYMLYLGMFSMFSLGWLYNSDQTSPLPRLKDQSIVELMRFLKNDTIEFDWLFIDQLEWESAYYMALNAPLRPQQIVLCGNFHANEVANAEWDIFQTIEGEKLAVISNGTLLNIHANWIEVFQGNSFKVMAFTQSFPQ